jgi:hypothetical protein
MDALNAKLFRQDNGTWYVNVVLALVIVLVVVLLWFVWSNWVSKEGFDALAAINSGGRMNLSGVEQGQMYFGKSGFTGQPVGPEVSALEQSAVLRHLQTNAYVQETNDQIEGFSAKTSSLSDSKLQGALNGM